MSERDDPRRLLVVDDDPAYVEPVAARLDERVGSFDIVTVGTVAEGLDLLDDRTVDCIVSAYILPDGTGIEFLETVRDAHPALPVVLVTDRGSEAVASEAISAGVSEYVPWRGDDDQSGALAARIEKALTTPRPRGERMEEPRLYERAFTEMEQGACLYDVDGRFELVNEYLADFYGTTPEALEGKRSRLLEAIREGSAGDPYRALLDGETDIVHGETTFELPGRGEVVVNYRLVPLRIAGDVEGVVGVARDVTEREAREQQLRRAREEYQELINGMNDTAWVIGTDERFLAVNDAAVEKLGYSRDELLSMDPHDIDAGLSDDEISELIGDMPEDGIQVFETAHRTKDGDVIPVEISSSLITYRGETAILSVARDITERKQYEEALQEQNRTLERQRDELEVLNQVLRHDIRNDLQLVTAYADILRGHVDDEGAEHLETVHDRAKHAVELTQTAGDTAELMRPRNAESERIDLQSVLEEEVADLRNRYPDAEVVVPSAVPSVSVRANEMLASLFRNLLTNAIQHNDAAVPEVTVTATEHGDRVTVRVADNGPGVPDDRKEAIFGEGQKDIGSYGTGLGLHLVETLLDQYGGSVHVEDNDPTGAVFVVDLPKAE